MSSETFRPLRDTRLFYQIESLSYCWCTHKCEYEPFVVKDINYEEIVAREIDAIIADDFLSLLESSCIKLYPFKITCPFCLHNS